MGTEEIKRRAESSVPMDIYDGNAIKAGTVLREALAEYDEGELLTGS